MQSLEMAYLGMTPIKGHASNAVETATNLLQAKLRKVQRKTVARLVEKTHGSKLPVGSAAYNKVVDKIAISGLDHTAGDKIRLNYSLALIELFEIKGGEVLSEPVHSFSIDAIEGNHVMPSALDSTLHLLTLVCRSGKKKVGHVLQGEHEKCMTLSAHISGIKAAMAKEKSQTAHAGLLAFTNDDENTNTLTMGIGLHQTSDLEVKGFPSTRRNTINLKGNGRMRAKRRSHTYGQSFTSIPIKSRETQEEPIKTLPDKEKDDDLAAFNAPPKEAYEVDDEEEFGSKQFDELLEEEIEGMRKQSLSSDVLNAEDSADDLDFGVADEDDDEFEGENFGFEGLDEDGNETEDSKVKEADKQSLRPNGVPEPPPRSSFDRNLEDKNPYEKPMHNPDYTSSDEEMDANPSKHVPLDDKSNMMRIPWMHGRMDRTIAENLLRGPEVGQGAFLMRESQSHKGDFTLTIKNGSRIAHCRIVRNYRGLFALKVCADRDFVDSDGNRGGPWFADIETLVAEYSLNPIPTLRTREGRGLVLRNPLLREAGSSRENISPNNKENNPNFKIGFDYRTSEDSKKANPAKDAYSNMTEIQADEANKSQDDFSVDELYE
eukprot:m.54987 g.54987  ORF g.54987 m.54987 type:complete len:603 (-) comp10961_c0_seq8:70-1878(-)